MEAVEVIEVVDTNVWAAIDKIPPKDKIEANCIKACVEWAQAFIAGGESRRIAVDMTFKILTEYRGQIKKGGLAEQYLNQLQSQPMARIEFVEIEFDDDGNAILPDTITGIDASDRKFVAVALNFDPHLLIINALDSDWEKARETLDAAGIAVQELCPDYVQAKMK